MPSMLRMGMNFAKYVPHGSSFVPSEEDLEISIRTIIGLEVSDILLAIVEDEIAGALICCVSPIWYNTKEIFASEMGWWMDEKHRTGVTALRLIVAFEDWAKEKGATYCTMCDMIIPGEKSVGRIYEKIGYNLVERTFTKRL